MYLNIITWFNLEQEDLNYFIHEILFLHLVHDFL